MMQGQIKAFDTLATRYPNEFQLFNGISSNSDINKHPSSYGALVEEQKLQLRAFSQKLPFYLNQENLKMLEEEFYTVRN